MPLPAGMLLESSYIPRDDRDWIWSMRDELDQSLHGVLFALWGIVLAMCHRALGGPESGARNA